MPFQGAPQPPLGTARTVLADGYGRACHAVLAAALATMRAEMFGPNESLGQMLRPCVRSRSLHDFPGQIVLGLSITPGNRCCGRAD